jgi:uncharacterized OsmC-like protein
MYETTVRFTKGVAFEVEARGHRIVCDQPRENGGEDAGMNPPELMMASLGTCAGFYAVQYLKFRNLSLDGLTIRVSGEKAAQPARIGSIRIEVDSPGAEDPKHHQGLQRAVEKCLIHATLMHAPAIEIELQPLMATT